MRLLQCFPAPFTSTMNGGRDCVVFWERGRGFIDVRRIAGYMISPNILPDPIAWCFHNSRCCQELNPFIPFGERRMEIRMGESRMLRLLPVLHGLGRLLPPAIEPFLPSPCPA